MNKFSLKKIRPFFAVLIINISSSWSSLLYATTPIYQYSAINNADNIEILPDYWYGLANYSYFNPTVTNSGNINLAENYTYTAPSQYAIYTDARSDNLRYGKSTIKNSGTININNQQIEVSNLLYALGYSTTVHNSGSLNGFASEEIIGIGVSHFSEKNNTISVISNEGDFTLLGGKKATAFYIGSFDNSQLDVSGNIKLNATSEVVGVYSSALTQTININKDSRFEVLSDTTAYGFRLRGSNINLNHSASMIIQGNHQADGMYIISSSANIKNDSDIKISSLLGKGNGIYSASYNSEIENSGKIELNSTTARGIFAGYGSYNHDANDNPISYSFLGENLSVKNKSGGYIYINAKTPNLKEVSAIVLNLASNASKAEVINEGKLHVINKYDKDNITNNSGINGYSSVITIFNNESITNDTKIIINNSGEIINEDDNGYAIYFYALKKDSLSEIDKTNTTPVEITNTGTIESKFGIISHAGEDKFTQTSGSTIGNISLGDGNNSLYISGGNYEGDILLGNGDDTVTLTGSNTYITGKVSLGDGSDQLNLLDHIDVSGIVLLDGGDDSSTDDGYIDTLTVQTDISLYTSLNNNNSSSQSRTNQSGINTINWEQIKIGDNNNLNLTTVTLTGNLQTGSVVIANNGILALSNEINSLVISANVTNSGILDLSSNGQTGDNIVIDGNYQGNAGSVIKMNFALSQDGDYVSSDNLTINGSASGQSEVQLVGSNGTKIVLNGTETVLNDSTTSLPIITLKNSTEQDIDLSFTLKGTLETQGAAEINIVRESSGTNYYWKVSKVGAVATNYIGINKAIQEQAFEEISSLDERRGESWKKAFQPSWIRLYHKNLNQSGKLNIDSNLKLSGIQMGYDFLIKENSSGKIQRSGIYLSYAQGTNTLENRNRPIGYDRKTGQTKVTSIGLGMEYLTIYEDGRYLDLVGQLSQITNKYLHRTVSHITQSGWLMSLSSEYGHNITLLGGGKSNWKAEPQVQLIYQYFRLNNLWDGVRAVNDNTQQSLRARLGLKIKYMMEKDINIYMKTNLWGDFLSARYLHIGENKQKEKYSRIWYSLGLGGNYPINDKLKIYGEMVYEGQLDNKKRNSTKGNIGVSYSF